MSEKIKHRNDDAHLSDLCAGIEADVPDFSDLKAKYDAYKALPPEGKEALRERELAENVERLAKIKADPLYGTELREHFLYGDQEL